MKKGKGSGKKKENMTSLELNIVENIPLIVLPQREERKRKLFFIMKYRAIDRMRIEACISTITRRSHEEIVNYI